MDKKLFWGGFDKIIWQKFCYIPKNALKKHHRKLIEFFFFCGKIVVTMFFAVFITIGKTMVLQ